MAPSADRPLRTESARVAGLIGTVHTRVGGQNIPNTRTTPESSDFQRLLARMAGPSSGTCSDPSVCGRKMSLRSGPIRTHLSNQ